ncbi:MAG: GNAT family N-acetyltransferase [Clostridia bacterium]|nr:GNAT family N-acetyltransferase [Clostridia bacterium]
MKTLEQDLKALYSQCFSDSKECVDYMFSEVLGARNAEYEYLDGNLAAAMYLVQKPLVYLGRRVVTQCVIGLCTSPSYRKRGLALSLMKRSVEKVAEPFVTLYPAVKGFYEKMGFATVSFDDVISYGSYLHVPASAEKMLNLYKEYIEGMDFYLPMTQTDFERLTAITRLDGGSFELLIKDGRAAGFGNGEEGIVLGGTNKQSGVMARITSPEAAFALTDIDLPFSIRLTDALVEKNNFCFRVEKGKVKKTDGCDAEITVEELSAHFFGYKGLLGEFFPCISGYILERY